MLMVFTLHQSCWIQYKKLKMLVLLPLFHLLLHIVSLVITYCLLMFLCIFFSFFSHHSTFNLFFSLTLLSGLSMKNLIFHEQEGFRYIPCNKKKVRGSKIYISKYGIKEQIKKKMILIFLFRYYIVFFKTFLSCKKYQYQVKSTYHLIYCLHLLFKISFLNIHIYKMR